MNSDREKAREITEQFAIYKPFTDQRGDLKLKNLIVKSLREERKRVLESEEIKQLEQAIKDWLHSYAPEFCGKKYVKETAKRINKKGTLSYIANTLAAFDEFRRRETE